MAPKNGWLEYDRFLLGWPIFRGYVSFRECIPPKSNIDTSPLKNMVILSIHVSFRGCNPFLRTTWIFIEIYPRVFPAMVGLAVLPIDTFVGCFPGLS